MRRLTTFAVAVLFLSGDRPGLAQDKRHPEAIQVMLPRGTVSISYVEAAEGMMVYIECEGVTVKGRRVLIGDGTVAVQYEATHAGFYTPDGKADSNTAGAEHKAGAVVRVTRENRRAWAAKAGEVYVLIPGIRFEEKT